MSPPLNPQISDGICRFYPAGECTLVEAVDLVREAIAYCLDHRIGKVMIDVRALTGVPIPTLIDRFLMAEEWAQEARSMVVAVLVAHREYIHPEKFAMMVARDMGLMSEVFDSENEALDWIASADPY